MNARTKNQIQPPNQVPPVVPARQLFPTWTLGSVEFPLWRGRFGAELPAHLRIDPAMNLPLLERLSPCKSVLLAGAGGGFDVCAGLPLAHWLRAQGKQVHLASLSFSELKPVKKMLGHQVHVVDADSPAEEEYFPEKYLSQWYRQQGLEQPVYCYKMQGCQQILEGYQKMAQELNLDALILVDGGTDILMRGDEPGLGTPAEDMTSLAAADQLDLPVKLVLNLGFGVDVFHEVCHHYVLEAVADLTTSGGFLGAFSLLPQMAEFQHLVDALDYIHARMPGKESIVMSSVVAAGQGKFGDFHPFPGRTRDSVLFINPLMSMYWCFDLTALAKRCLYLDYLKEKYSRWDIHRGLVNFMSTVTPREWKTLPI